MRYEQARPLVNTLMEIAVLHHASPSLLREKIYKALDEFLPDMDEGCRNVAASQSMTLRKKTMWPFPPFPNPKEKGNKTPKFNPDNYEESPV